MFSRSMIDDSWSVDDNSRVFRMMFVSDATTWSITYHHHSEDFKGVIYDCDIFMVQATRYKHGIDYKIVAGKRCEVEASFVNLFV
jgi:hypothetical protein